MRSERVRGHIRKDPRTGKNVFVIAYSRTAEEDAPGIPNKNRILPIPTVTTPEKWILVIQEHEADRAGKHYDYRLVDRKGNAHSFASRYLLEKGQTTLSAQQPTHTKQYALHLKSRGVVAKKVEKGQVVEAEITDGYGKGIVRLHTLEPVQVTKANNDKISVVYLSGHRVGRELSFIRQEGNSWRIVDHTLKKEWFEEIPKPAMSEITADKFIPKNYTIVTPKLDGARSIVYFPGSGKRIRVLSHRRQKDTDEVIDYTHKLSDFGMRRTPTGLGGTIAIGETIVLNSKNKPAHASEVGGLLNSTIGNAKKLLKDNKYKTKVVLFDLYKYRGRDVSKYPYETKLKLLETVAKADPQFSVIEYAKEEHDKQALAKKVLSGKHPLTTEGLVAHRKNHAPIKVKPRYEFDVYIRKFFPGTGKLENKGVGGFEFSWTPNGNIVGRVGTGFTEDQRKEMYDKPKKYLDRVARVTANEKLRSGALRGPSFNTMHIEKNQ